MQKKIIKILTIISFALLAVAFLNTYLKVKVWDYDFWWHLASGKYIVDHKGIPSDDPFSLVNDLEENKNSHPLREQMILKQYWLSQVIFYLIYASFGDTGIIVLRSLILFLLVALVFIWFRRQNISFYIIYPFVFLIFTQTMRFTGERPVLFTVLFVVLAFMLLDSFKQKKSKTLLLLIPLMTIWANMHGGFILGLAIIAAYMAGESINYFFLKKGTMEKKALQMLCIVGFVAVAASAINPNGFAPFMTVTEQSKLFHENVQEYFSPLYLYQNKLRPLDWGFIFLAFLFPVVAVWRRMRMDIVYYLLLGGLLFMSLSALRFMIFFVCIGTMILGRELHLTLFNFLEKRRIDMFRYEAVASVLMIASSAMFAAGFVNLQSLSFTTATKSTVPKGAVDFIETNRIEGNIFNDMGSGGYLMWRLYPWKKVFIDTRQLNYIVRQESSWILEAKESIYNKELPAGKVPLWERLLNHYDIDVVIVDYMDIFGHLKPLPFTLLKHDQWVPVYSDLISLLFVRKTPQNTGLIERFRLDEDMIYNFMIARLTQWSIMDKKNPRYFLSLGEIFYLMGRNQDALMAFQYADRRYPNQAGIIEKIDILKKKIEKENEKNEKRSDT